MIGIPAPWCEPGHVCWPPARLSIVRSQQARQRTCLQRSFFWSWKRSLAALAPTEARSSSAPRGTFRSSCRARAGSLRVRSTMPLDAALTSSEWRGSRHPTSGAFQRHREPITFIGRDRRDAGKGSRNMSSQEELVRCLRKLTEALASHDARRLSIVRQHDRPPVACADEAPAPVKPDQVNR